MKDTQESFPTFLKKLRQMTGDASTVSQAIADLEPDMDDPLVAEWVRKTLHDAATDPRYRAAWPVPARPVLPKPASDRYVLPKPSREP